MRGHWIPLTLLLVGCATSTAQQRWVSDEYGFAIERPNDESWKFTTGHQGPEGILIPVVVTHTSGAQVVVQIAPEVAAAHEFAEKLAMGLTERHGFLTSVPEVLDDASAEFLFAAEGVYGRVGILRGDGRLFVLLGTWPADAPEEVAKQVHAIMKSLKATTPPPRPPERVFATQ